MLIKQLKVKRKPAMRAAKAKPRFTRRIVASGADATVEAGRYDR